MRLLLSSLALTAILSAAPALAHDIWINKERRINQAGEWCCNTHDCKPVKATAIKGGYRIDGTGEFVPNDDAAMAGAGGDDDYWLCRRPDGTRRCFFFPPPGT